MNVRELNPGTEGTIALYVAVVLSLTLTTVWVIITYQSKHMFPEDVTFVKRLGWPVFLLLRLFGKDVFQKKSADAKRSSIPIGGGMHLPEVRDTKR